MYFYVCLDNKNYKVEWQNMFLKNLMATNKAIIIVIALLSIDLICI